MESRQMKMTFALFAVVAASIFSMALGVTRRDAQIKAQRSVAGADVYFDHQSGTFY